MSGADITATVMLVPRPPRTVGHLKLIVKEERDGGILEGERNRKPSVRRKDSSIFKLLFCSSKNVTGLWKGEERERWERKEQKRSEEKRRGEEKKEDARRGEEKK